MKIFLNTSLLCSITLGCQSLNFQSNSPTLEDSFSVFSSRSLKAGGRFGSDHQISRKIIKKSENDSQPFGGESTANQFSQYPSNKSGKEEKSIVRQDANGSNSPRAFLKDSQHGILNTEDQESLARLHYRIGSCKDDIYASWLVEQYKIVHPLESQNKADKEAWEKDALAYAISKLSMTASETNKHTLPVVDNPDVNRWIRYFKTSDRSTFLQWLSNGEALEHLILPELDNHGIPREFFFLAMIESGFNTHAKSGMSALGAWQLMPATGKLYHLKINKYIDERKDPVKSTIAAAKLLSNLYHKFGDWYLAMAAYNAGPTIIQKAIIKGNTRDFWTLAKKSLIPSETAQYIPRWIAAYTLGSEPEKYGFYIKQRTENLIPKSYVKLSQSYRLNEIAKSINIKIETLKTWNPEILQDLTPPLATGKTYLLRVNDNLKEQLEKNLKEIPFLNIKEIITYKIGRGDTINAIAKKHGISTQDIIRLNPEVKPTHLRIGKTISIPAS